MTKPRIKKVGKYLYMYEGEGFCAFSFTPKLAYFEWLSIKSGEKK